MHIINLFFTFFYFSIIASSQSRKGQLCPRWFSDSNSPRCVGTDGVSDIEGRKECAAAKHCCVGRNEVCYAMPRRDGSELDTDQTDEEMMSAAKDIMKSMKRRATERFLSIGPFSQLTFPYGGDDPYPGFPTLPTFVCQEKPSFPDDCDVSNTKSTRYTRHPPLNIPYCVRTQCDPTKPELETTPNKCREIPGCFFDRPLSDYRARFGHSFMPGVPVCQLAIRNAVFLEEARKIVKKTGSWSPYLNECLLDTFDQVIRTPKEGCKLINMLQYFKHKAKLAGWKSINEYNCYLIDACWVDGKCYYPVDISKLTVSAAPTTQEQKMSSSLYYGRPRCQDFNDKTPKDAIDSYHNCLISGCKLDKHAQNSYYNYLFDFGKSMDRSDHWVFWRMVESGKYGAHNIDEYESMPKQDVTVTPFSLVVKYPSQPGQTSLIDELQTPGSSSLLDILKSGSGLQLPPQHDSANNPFFQQLQELQTPCSTAFTSFGGRPCGPPKYTASDVPDHCPYKPIEVRGLKPLRGSFDGCCDITLCYQSREDLLGARSGAATYYSIWSYWTECSVTCGEGTKKRWRHCIGNDQSQCKGPTTENSKCQLMPCSSWSKWGRWSTCSATCMGGLIERSRTCNPSGGFCPGPSQETKECNTAFCLFNKHEKYGQWSSWSGTCEPCGKTIYRSRKCNNNFCSDDELYESKRCPVKCSDSWTKWSAWGPCLWDFVSFGVCKESRSRQCSNGPSQCDGEKFEQRQCDCPN